MCTLTLEKVSLSFLKFKSHGLNYPATTDNIIIIISHNNNVNELVLQYCNYTGYNLSKIVIFSCCPLSHLNSISLLPRCINFSMQSH